MNEARRQPSLELFDILHAPEEQMLEFRMAQDAKLEALAEIVQKHDTRIYILKATIEQVLHHNEHERMRTARKVNAIALKEFRDPSKIREQVNFNVYYEDDDVLDEEFFSQSYNQLKQAGYDPEMLFRLAEERRRAFNHKMQRHNKTELGAYENISAAVSDYFEHSGRLVDDGAVFSACYMNKVNLQDETGTWRTGALVDAEFIDFPALERYVGALHRKLNFMRAQKQNLLNEQSNLQSKITFQQDVMQHLQSTCRHQETAARTERLMRESMSQKICSATKKRSYDRPWRAISSGGAMKEPVLVRYLRQALTETHNCVYKIVIDCEMVRNSAQFRNYKNYSFERFARYLVHYTEFLADLRWLYELLARTAQKNVNTMNLGAFKVFITE